MTKYPVQDEVTTHTRKAHTTAFDGPNLPDTTSSSTSTTSTSAHSTPTTSFQTTSPLVTASEQVAMSTSSMTASASPASQHGGASITKGVLAGSIVGVAAASAIITFLTAFLWFRKKTQQRNPDSQDHSGSRSRWSKPHSKTVALGKKPLDFDASDSDSAWQAFLPQSADDHTIQSAVKTLFDQIELHVDNYYNRIVVDSNEHYGQTFERLDSRNLPAPAGDLMTENQLQLPVIKHCIAGTLVSSIVPGNRLDLSLLPPHLTMVPIKINSTSVSTAELSSAQQAYSHWKVLCSFLNPRPTQDSAFTISLDTSIRGIEEIFESTLSPWRSVPDDPAERRNRHDLIRKAADVGILILSQPSSFEFRWQPASLTQSNTSNGIFVMLPGFWKVTDERGRHLQDQQLLVSPAVVNI